MGIEAGNHRKSFAAGTGKNVFVLHSYFLQGFEAVAHESRAYDEDFFCAFAGQFAHALGSVRREPFFAAQAGLEGEFVFVFGDTQFFRYQLRGAGYLCLLYTSDAADEL